MARTHRKLSVTPMTRAEWERYSRGDITYERYLTSLTGDRHNGRWYPSSQFRRGLNSAYRAKVKQALKNWKAQHLYDDIELPPFKRNAWWLWF
jgi:hypothetical protein